jgi:hypothetical protein
MSVTHKLDRTGQTASLACAIHCALMPLVITFLPLMGLAWLASEAVEWSLFGFSAIIGSISLCLGYRQHGSKAALKVLAVGLAVLALGRLADEHQWSRYYVVLLVAGGCTVAASHFVNSRLCRSCSACHPHGGH